ncbi:hypothetical protein G3569_15730 [Aliifodinibius halophilus]|uniref:Uncharacterized protein n=2 Tax=Fodinibius halophilus TaxID=1736908 RepID=A0A6M1T152_9BACT|nr:hypothetical protein [Fodinibius halophilus]
MKNTVLFLVMAFLFVSCMEEDNWLKDNMKETGNSYPNISDFEIIDKKDEYQEGETVQMDLLFWSEDPVKEIVLKDSVVSQSSQQVYGKWGYEEASFSEASQTDSLRIAYTIPTVPNDTTEINLEVQVVNENGLTMNNVDTDNFAAGPIDITVIK